MLGLDPKQIHLWCVYFDQIRDEDLLGQYRRLLSEQERQQASRFYFAKDRHRYLLTRALTRTVLSRYASIAPEAWLFGQNAHGRPEIANDDQQARRIVFNITHTDSLIVLAVGCGRALGIDTEHLLHRPAPLEIADHFFSASEARALAALPLDQRQARFYQYWTLKESYIKARGMGLSIPLDQFSFDIQAPARVSLSTQAQLDDLAAHWRFWQLRLEGDYLLAVCAGHLDDVATELLVQQLVPMREATTLDHVLLLSSHPR